MTPGLIGLRSENISRVFPLRLATLLLKSRSYKAWKVLILKVFTNGRTEKRKKSEFEVAHHLKTTDKDILAEVLLTSTKFVLISCQISFWISCPFRFDDKHATDRQSYFYKRLASPSLKNYILQENKMFLFSLWRSKSYYARMKIMSYLYAIWFQE